MVEEGGSRRREERKTDPHIARITQGPLPRSLGPNKQTQSSMPSTLKSSTDPCRMNE